MRIWVVEYRAKRDSKAEWEPDMECISPTRKGARGILKAQAELWKGDKHRVRAYQRVEGSK